ncbi:HPF/RaiA family ribosome-associated protein [Fulvivirga sp.]|uniref:HPF/RaiA family ribosome-associated protein n=1 Tax=Fulvivirga sp. TaxID=1931237 RepID=UPI0032EBC75E
MKTIIEFVETARNEELETRVNEEVAKISERYDWITAAFVYFRKDNAAVGNCLCELEIRLPGNPIFIKESADNFNLAITKTIEAVKRQLEKRKEKLYHH